LPRFKVDIHGEELDRVRVALDGVGIPSIGPARGEWAEDPASRQVDTVMSAYLSAVSPEVAEARVRDALPAGGEYTVSPAELRPEQSD
jgi:hypothetical protein